MATRDATKLIINNKGEYDARSCSILFGHGCERAFRLACPAQSRVEALIRGVTGFVAYTLVQTADGGISVTVCQDKAGADESLQRAREWIQANAAGTGVGAPTVSEGSVILQLS